MHSPLTELASRFAFHYFYHNILHSNRLIVFINYTLEYQESRSTDSATLRLEAARIDSRVLNFFVVKRAKRQAIYRNHAEASDT